MHDAGRPALDAPRSAADTLARARRVAMLVCDVDGVLTDGRLYIGAQGELMKAFDVRDGHGIKLLREAGIEVALLTARRSDIVAARARELGIARVLQGQADKLAGFTHLLADTGIAADACGYIGDDWPDLPCLQRAGFAATVADGCAEAKARAHWISTADGGRGAVRELAEFILRAQGKFDELLRKHTEGVLHA
jgi:3-deoxy-D-manno-octulosonate 8-phosphate phosphatase (KDO 8-P phosphatase)